MSEQEALTQGELSSNNYFRGGPGFTSGIESGNNPESVVGRVIPTGPVVQMREGEVIEILPTSVVGQMGSEK